MKLIVGLGNPGKEYEKTRHNVGYMVIDKVIERLKLNFNKEKFNGTYIIGNILGEKVIILKPLKYMNLSGEVIKQFIDYYKINIEDILVISDDLDMDVGKLKLKQNGRSGGHNGLNNIEQNLKTKNYKRLKIGISNDKLFDTADYVLGKFNDEELEKISIATDRARDIVIEFINGDFPSLMNKYNGS